MNYHLVQISVRAPHLREGVKFALVQPNWDFFGSTYFGCREPHLPLELLYARHRLKAAGHQVLLLDAHLESISLEEAQRRTQAFKPDFLVIPTAPTYLFWRCPQPELRIPAQWMKALRGGATTVAIGPHASVTPHVAMLKLEADIAIRGEPEQVLPLLLSSPLDRVPGCCEHGPKGIQCSPTLAQSDLASLPALDLTGYPMHLRHHRHHVFTGTGRGAELEFSRGCPWDCIFCNKTAFRGRFRERRVADVLTEIELLLRAGIDYFYFIDEIFGCSRNIQELLDELTRLPLTFGMQTRIDLWDEDSLELLGHAHCVSMECGVESITPAGRESLEKRCRLSTARIEDLLRAARAHIPWVQANLIATDDAHPDDLADIESWRRQLIASGVWVSTPVPLYPYPGTPRYQQLWGPPDDRAWERAHDYYLTLYRSRLSDIQDTSPRTLAELEDGL